MNLFHFVLFVAIASHQTWCQESPPTCENSNEKYSQCGNLCEDSCDNTCDAPAFLSFGKLRPAFNPDCVPGCYCDNGYIRDGDGECVLNVPGVCDTDRCATSSRNAVYVRCSSGGPPACFKRNFVFKTGGFTGRCMCAQGYSMNSKSKCVRTDSAKCKAEAGKSLTIVNLNTPDCE